MTYQTFVIEIILDLTVLLRALQQLRKKNNLFFLVGEVRINCSYYGGPNFIITHVLVMEVTKMPIPTCPQLNHS